MPVFESSRKFRGLFSKGLVGRLLSNSFLCQFQDYDDEDLKSIKKGILVWWDADKDGRIYIDELKMMLRAQRQMADK